MSATTVGPPAPRLIAFYLPQYHRIPENDAWWGPGFTEWTNVARARPLFRGHDQPHLPADLGFYDLRLAETREAQADLARRFGIAGFCYYHYWFEGRRILERPFDEVLASDSPDFPFCLCWANEPWTRRWDGKSGEFLLEQRYSVADDYAHIDWMLRAFEDPRYLRVDGKPLFLVYRASSLPDSRRTTDLWRERAAARGFGGLHLACVESFPEESTIPPGTRGFDSAVEFQPDWGLLVAKRWELRLRSLMLPGRIKRLRQRIQAFDYGTIVDAMMSKAPPNYLRHPCVMPGWDNTPRRIRNSCIFLNRSPEKYGEWLALVLRRAAAASKDPLVLVNAWNEWGEGNHLEPCQRFGSEFLKETKSRLEAFRVAGGDRS